MNTRFLTTLTLVAAGIGALSARDVAAQGRRPVEPERQLVGVRLGRPMLEVVRRFGTPSEIQPVALASQTENLPGLGGGATEGLGGAAMGGMAGYGAMMGAMSGGGAGPAMSGPSLSGAASTGGGFPPYPGAGGGASSFGGGSPFGGIPTSAPGGSGAGMPAMYGAMMGQMAGGGMSGMSGMSGGAMGSGGTTGAGAGLPGSGSTVTTEYSTAVLLIYRRGESRLEFLINEDGRVAQISVASPAKKPYPGVRTARGVSMGSSYLQVVENYGNAERHRLLPGLRFYEAYYSKSHHAAFTFDTTEGMKVVRITIALAD